MAAETGVADHVFDPTQVDVVEAVRELTGGFGADVVVDAVGRPETYEQAFYARDLAGTVVLVGVPHPDFGEAVVAVVAPRPGAALEPDALMNALTDRIARFKQPKRVIVVPELPRNAMGKVQKNLLRDRYKARMMALGISPGLFGLPMVTAFL